VTVAELGRYEDKIEAEPNCGCWLWVGARLPNGYGSVRISGRTVYAHRASYEHWRGAIPDGLQIDHLCRVRNCVNPSHLEAVTQRENMMRGEGRAAQRARWLLCPRGHELSVRIRPRGRRLCLVCVKDYQRRYMISYRSRKEPQT
jgi:hypothetical protein